MTGASAACAASATAAAAIATAKDAGAFASVAQAGRHCEGLRAIGALGADGAVKVETVSRIGDRP